MTPTDDLSRNCRKGRTSEPRRSRWCRAALLALASPLPLAGQGGEEPAAPDERASWQPAALGATVLGVTFLLDEPVRDLSHHVQGETGRDLSRLGRRYGAWDRSGPYLMAGGLAVGLILEGDVGARKAVAAALGVLAGSMTNEAVNQTLGRRRPDEEAGAFQFDPFHGHASLGSGHAAYTFAIAGAIDEVTEGWWSAPFYVAAVGTGIARVYVDRHWLSDVVVGGFIGLWIGRRSTRTAARLLGVGPGQAPHEAASPSLVERLEPVFEPGFVGLRLRH